MDARFTQPSGTNVFNGNELLVKGALEAGVSLLVGYPGSPVADVFEVAGRLRQELTEHGVVVQIANNEALTAARLNGSQMLPVRALGLMKSVGGHVAADGLAISNLAGVHPQGGAVLAIGDDPWTDSTQVPADSRFLFQHLRMPVVEPATFQELKDWIDLSFQLSAGANLMVGYLVTTNQADGGATVTVGTNRWPRLNAHQRAVLETDKISTDDRVMLAPDTARAEIDVAERRFVRLLEIARPMGINQILAGGPAPRATARRPLGLVTCGLAYCYVQHALDELGVQGRVPILKFGLTYPLDPEIVLAFAQQVEELVVVEERRGLLEQQLAAILQDAYQQGRLERLPKVWGKHFPHGLEGIPETRGLNPSLVLEHLTPMLLAANDPQIGLDAARTAAELELIEQVTGHAVAIPLRTPAFCPGCPHRDSATAFKDLTADFENPIYMGIHHNCAAQDLVFHGDIGCYVMLKYDPYKRLMHNLSGMGLGGGTGAGVDPFIDNKQVVFMGDSTFFHSGMSAISDSIKNGQDITYVILDNKTTAMTGHQPTPAQEQDFMGRPTVAQDIEKIVRAMGRGRWGSSHVKVTRINPEARQRYRKLIEQTALRPGVKVIVADKECAITAGRRRRRERRETVATLGYVPREQFVNINADVCEHCLECTKSTGCTGLNFVETDYGRKVTTDDSFCVNDGACSKRLVCPSFERVDVSRKMPPPSRWPWSTGPDDGRPSFPELPQVEPKPFSGSYNVYLAGVGGMGVGTLTAILARAAAYAGLDCQLCDKKGLAIRNGGVYSRIQFSRDARQRSPLIPYGKTDLLIGLDLLEAVRATDPRAQLCAASPGRTVALVNAAQTPTVAMLMEGQTGETEELIGQLQASVRAGQLHREDLFTIAERLLGHKLYANMMMLGLAYQKRLLPMGLAPLLGAAAESTSKADWDDNLRAFHLGRLLVHCNGDWPSQLRGRLEPQPVNPTGLCELIEDKARILRRRWRGLLPSEGFRISVEQARREMPELNEDDLRHLVLRFYDLIQYQNLRYARRTYLQRVIETYRRDQHEYGYAATKAVMHYLYKVVAIKDEVWVSHLLTSEEKRRRDYARFRIDPARGDRIRYVHLNRPEFNLFGLKFQFHVKSRPWMLRAMRHMKFLRRLPGWHARERYFRDRYQLLVDRFRYHSKDAYDELVEVLSLPDQVRGYVEVRYPTMVEPLRRIEAILNNPLFRDPPRRLPEAQAVQQAIPVHGQRPAGRRTVSN